MRNSAGRAPGNWSTPDAAPDLMTLARGAENPTQKLLALRGFIRLAADESLPADRRLAMAAVADHQHAAVHSLSARDRLSMEVMGREQVVPRHT